jgi:hypothetical protein
MECADRISEFPTVTDGQGRFSMTLSWGLTSRPLVERGLREVRLSVEYQGHRSDVVVISPMKSSRARSR